MSTFEHTSISLVKTAKAKSLVYLATLSFNYDFQMLKLDLFGVAPETLHVYPSMPHFWPSLSGRPDMAKFDVGPWPQFGRPAPMRPRHGFVESRMVTNMDDVKALFDEARAADPEAEVILMPRYTGTNSAVATPTSVTWGLGNAGVTSGTSEVRTIPVPGKINLHTYFARQSDVREFITDTAYIEAVEDQGKTRMVQLRNGPDVPAIHTWAPHGVQRITEVLEADFIDLLTWEGVVREHAGRADVAVWLPGQALTSHFAVHAIENGLAVTTGVVSPLFTIIRPEAPLPYRSDKRYTQLQSYLKRWTNAGDQFSDFAAQRSMMTTSLATLHSAGIWGDEPWLLNMRAFAAVALLRGAIAAVRGEMRHWPAHVKAPSKIVHADDYDDPEGSRTQIYKKVITAPFTTHYVLEMLAYLLTAEEDFNHLVWSNDLRHGSYGGPKWANVARVTRKALLEFKLFIEYPTARGWSDLWQALNIVVNTAHNNGSVYTKWGIDMDGLQRVPSLGFLNQVAATLTLDGISKEKVAI